MSRSSIARFRAIGKVVDAIDDHFQHGHGHYDPQYLVGYMWGSGKLSLNGNDLCAYERRVTVPYDYRFPAAQRKLRSLMRQLRGEDLRRARRELLQLYVIWKEEGVPPWENTKSPWESFKAAVKVAWNNA